MPDKMLLKLMTGKSINFKLQTVKMLRARVTSLDTGLKFMVAIAHWTLQKSNRRRRQFLSTTFSVTTRRHMFMHSSHADVAAALPKPKLHKFGEAQLEWETFKERFSAMVKDVNNIAPVMMLQHLMSCT